MKTTTLRPEGAREMHVTQFGDHAAALRRYATTDGYLFIDEEAEEHASSLTASEIAEAIEAWDAEMDGEWGEPDEGCDGSDDIWDYPDWRAMCARGAAYAVERASRAIAAAR